MRTTTRYIIGLMTVPALLAIVMMLAASDGAFDKPRAQATFDLMKIDRKKAHEFLGDNPRPDDEHWLVIDQVYEVWLNHDSSTPELEQLKRVVLSLKSQGYIFKSMTVTSFAPHMRRVRDSEVVATWQVPNTVLIIVQK